MIESAVGPVKVTSGRLDSSSDFERGCTPETLLWNSA